jgi:hypothetical protein
MGSYDLVSARVGWIRDDGVFGIALWGENLSDELYVTNRVRDFMHPSDLLRRTSDVRGRGQSLVLTSILGEEPDHVHLVAILTIDEQVRRLDAKGLETQPLIKRNRGFVRRAYTEDHLPSCKLVFRILERSSAKRATDAVLSPFGCDIHAPHQCSVRELAVSIARDACHADQCASNERAEHDADSLIIESRSNRLVSQMGFLFVARGERSGKFLQTAKT